MLAAVRHFEIDAGCAEVPFSAAAHRGVPHSDEPRADESRGPRMDLPGCSAPRDARGPTREARRAALGGNVRAGPVFA